MILKGFFKKEFIQLFRNRAMIAALFFAPIIQMIVMSYAITNEPKNIRLIVDCSPNDYILTSTYERAIASGWFKKVPLIKKSAFESVRSGLADVAVIAPVKGFTNGVYNGNAELQILADATNVLKAQAVEAYLKAITAEAIKEKTHSGISQPLVKFNTRIMFNPQMETRLFIIPFVIAAVITISILSLICISITREKEIGTMEMLISSPIKKSHIILGKILPFMCVSFLNMLLTIAAGILIFSTPLRGNIILLILSFLSFSVAISAIALFISTFCKTQQQAMLGMMIFMFLAIMLSGGMFPIENMPVTLRFLANINPVAHFTFLLRNILLKGSDLSFFFAHNISLWIFGTIVGSIAFKRFRTTL